MVCWTLYNRVGVKKETREEIIDIIRKYKTQDGNMS